MESKIICRLCFLSDESNIEIFSVEGIAFNISIILSKHFNFEVKKGDGLPQYICSACWDITRNFNDLFNRVENAFKVYFKSLEPIDNTENGIPNQIIDSTNVNQLLPADSIKDENNIFVEEFNVEFNSNVVTIEYKPDEQNFDTKTKRLRRNLIKDDAIRAKNEKTCQFEYDESDANDADVSFGNQKRERLREKEDSLIRDYFAMACEICPFEFSTFLEARGHYRKVHQKAGYLACCNKRFFYRGGLIDHITVHLNPEAFKCKVCEKTYGNKFALADHMELKHLPQEHRKYTCDECDRKFAKQYRLKQHIEVSHINKETKKERLICDNCGKTFGNKARILTHIRDEHLRNFSKMCDVCAKTFNCEKSFKSHVLTHTEQPRMQCNVCGRWLKSKDSLRSHLRRHTDTEHTCKFCDKVKPNRQALANHILYVHSERTHKCTLCEKAFKVALGLKEHMASHTGETLYKCPYCPKTFNSNGNMHKHRKNVHSTEWKNDRGKRMKKLISP